MSKTSKAEKALLNGDYQLAEKLYIELIDKYPDNPVYYNNLAITYLNQSAYQEALNCLSFIVKKYPKDINTINNIANVYKAAGNIPSAIHFYNLANVVQPNEESYLNLAVIYKNNNEIDSSLENYSQAVALTTDNYALCYNAAITYKESGNSNKAIEYYKKAISINPEFISSYKNLSNIFYLDNDFINAAFYYQKIVETNPTIENIIHIARMYFLGQDYNNSEKYLKKALEIKNLPEIYLMLGTINYKTGNMTQAAIFYENAINLNQSLVNLYQNIGFCYEFAGDIDNAKKYLEKYLSIFPDDTLIKFHFDLIANPIMFDGSEIYAYRKMLNEKIRHTLFSQEEINLSEFQTKNIQPPESLIYHFKNDSRIKKEYAELFKGIFPKLNNKNKIEGKPKIGFFVNMGQEDKFIYSMKGIINNLSKDKFDLTVISNNMSNFQNLKDNFPDIYLLNVSENLYQSSIEINEKNFDIIYYWETNHDSISYFLPFFRLAPIQITSIGYPTTSGITEMDYFVSSELLEPDDAKQHYTEKLYKIQNIPEYISYEKEINLENKENSVRYFSLPDGKNIYLCLQNLKKIHPEFDYLISSILKKDKNGIIVFISDKYQLINEKLKKRIITKYPEISDSIYFIDTNNKSEYNHLINISTLCIDTINYSGNKEIYDSFTHNLPVITLPGIYQRSRYTYACYKKMNIMDCVARDTDNYINLAVNIANNPELRQSIIDKINNNKHLLFDNNETVNDFNDMIENLIINFNK